MNTEYESHTDNNDAVCPYCGSAYQVESEDYAFETRIELCDDCEKYYRLESFVDVTHRASPDCELNGVEHDWSEKVILRTGRAYRYCNVCGKVKSEEDFPL